MHNLANKSYPRKEKATGYPQRSQNGEILPNLQEDETQLNFKHGSLHSRMLCSTVS